MAHTPFRYSEFGDARRFREAAEVQWAWERTRQSYARPPRPPRHHPRPSVAPWVVLGGALGIFGLMALGMMIMTGMFVAVLAALVGVAVLGAARSGHRRRAFVRAGGRPGVVYFPAAPPLPAVAPRPDLVWGRVRNRFHALRAAYAAHECDPMQVLRLPALSDVTVPSTARFVDAFAEAQALETDAYPGGSHAASFQRAVEGAERCWGAAREAAERIRLSRLSPAERSTVERVIKLLTMARDTDSDPERLAAYARARAELDKLDRAGTIHLPRTARAALDAAARPTLTA